jgi:D-glycero-D-manno-heptose 1,7-bisphosphate phosphatase
MLSISTTVTIDLPEASTLELPVRRTTLLPSEEFESDVTGWRVDDLEAVIVDRDGVINENRSDHVKEWAEFEFLAGAPEAVVRLCRAGLRVFVMTNQAIINRGIVSREVVDDVNRRMVAEIERLGGMVEAVVYCPHRPDECCGCRKPAPGLLTEIAQQHNVDLTRSLVVGDALSDVQAGRAAGCEAILVLSGRGRDQLASASDEMREGLVVAPDLRTVADWLLTQRSGALLADIVEVPA